MASLGEAPLWIPSQRYRPPVCSRKAETRLLTQVSTFRNASRREVVLRVLKFVLTTMQYLGNSPSC